MRSLRLHLGCNIGPDKQAGNSRLIKKWVIGSLATANLSHPQSPTETEISMRWILTLGVRNGDRRGFLHGLLSRIIQSQRGFEQRSKGLSLNLEETASTSLSSEQLSSIRSLSTIITSDRLHSHLLQVTENILF